ncbi:MAG: DUF6034 family protein [Eubacteriales bacterium]
MSALFNLIIINTILSSVMILFVLLAKGVFKNKIKPAVVSVLWIMVMVRLLMPFSIESPINIWSFMPEKETAAAKETMPSAEYNYAPPIYTMESEIDIPVAISPDSPTGIAYDELPAYTSNQPSAFQKIKTALESIDIPALSASIWIVCAIGILGINIVNMLIFAFFRIKGTAPADNVLSAFKRAKDRLGIKRPVDIFISEDITVPMAYSLFSPKILLPQNMIMHMDETKMELILMHELMHIKRLDILKNYLWLAAKAIYWFNPLVWIGYRQYVSDTEICCDYHVMKRLDEDLKIHYSQSLLDAAKMINKKPVYSAPYMLSFCESETKLRRRIMNILQPIKQSKKQTAVLAIMIMIISVCCFTTACQQVQPSPTPMATMPPAIHNEKIDDPTPTPQVIDFDKDGNPITATYSPDTTPEAFSLDYMNGKTITSSEYGLDMSVVFNLRFASQPSAGSFPSADVETHGFDTDFTRRAVEYFMGDEYFGTKLTKADYEKRLREYTELIEGVEMSSGDQAEVDEYIQILKDRIAAAPTENEEGETAFLSGKGPQQMLSLMGYTENGDIQEIIVDNSPGENYTFFYSRDNMFMYYTSIGTWYEGEDSEASEFAKYRRTALDAVSAICDKEMTMAAVEIGVTKDEYDVWTSYEDLISDVNADKCYIFYFTPIVENTLCTFGAMAKGIDDEREVLFASPWLSECITVVVDKDGILELSWTDPQEIKNLSTQNEVPITINDAIQIFERNIWDSRVFNDRSAISSKINITQITYGMVRIADDDGSQHLVPAYAFLGTQTNTRADDNEIRTGNRTNSNCYMLVHALTGEVIDFY